MTQSPAVWYTTNRISMHHYLSNRNRPVPAAWLIIVCLFPLFFTACNRATQDFVPLNADAPVLTELPAKLKKSHLKILPTEKTLVAERVVWFGLYYDGQRIAEELEWESSDTEALEFFYIYQKQGLYKAGFCRAPKKVTVRVTCQSVTVKRTFTIQPANRESGLQIHLPEPREFLQGSKVDFTITYDGENVTRLVKSYNTFIPEKPYPVYLCGKHEENTNTALCNLPGTTHILTMYNDDTVFRTVTIRDEPSPLRIRPPEDAVYRPGRRIQLTAWLGEQDITDSAEWDWFPVKNTGKEQAAVMTAKKGEFFCKASGMVFAFARYGEHSVFFTINVTD